MCWGAESTNRGERVFDHGQTNPPNKRFVWISAGSNHNCGLLVDGTAVCWGDNAVGQALPPRDVRFRSISAGDEHSCGVRLDGTVVCWGGNRWGQSDAPVGKFVSVDAGGYFTCGVRDGGRVACWGGRNYDHPGHEHIKLLVPSRNDFTQVSVGSVPSDGNVAPFPFACGLTQMGSTKCWTADLIEEIFDGPQSLKDPTTGQEPARQVCVGGHRTHFKLAGLREDGALGCWGLFWSNDRMLSAPPLYGFVAVSVGHFPYMRFARGR